MIKITLALTLLSFNLNAQEFPSPYCDIADPEITVEEITSVTLGDVNIPNSDISSILVDKTTTNAVVNPNTSFELSVKGNTYGNFENKIVAFIDWNQDDLFEGTDEIYEIGTLINSDGTDDTSVSMNIEVPEGALLGMTRIRITKTYSDPVSPAIINPCNIQFNPNGQGAFPGFGQALDFTLDVLTLSTASFELSALTVYPLPVEDVLNINYKTDLTLVKVYNLLGQEVLAKNEPSSTLELNVSTLKAGIYIVNLTSENANHSFRMIKK